MNRNEAIDYLTRCADEFGNHWYQGRIWSDPDTCPTCHGSNDAGWLHCPASRYGRTSTHCAVVAWDYARIAARGEPVTRQHLDEAMAQVVNDGEVPELVIRQYRVGLSGANMADIVQGYLECQLWAGLDMDRDDNGNNPPLDENYDMSDISPEYVDKVTAELTEVVTEHPLAVRMYLNYRGYYHTGVNGEIVRMREDRPGWDRNGLFGHDFYLTREHHGTGFWDRGLGELGRYLTDIAHAYGSAESLWDNGDGTLS